ncbi:hypothetical protein LCR01_14180 [Companilactobacillus crustorum]|uniref:Uncharacterized protein n=2 Tax=Companilactobacillus TaxID=2767879 RepID=A0A2P4R7I7_9LACO|nr:hypothetical protein [Companilactobacillus crustorum]GEO76975.1 hypothetical protein LCR01_14180 [Companilactobacillus crustorum]
MVEKVSSQLKDYDADDIDDILCELDNSKIRINALMDYNLKLRRLDGEQPNKALLSHEMKRLSPIMELLNTEIFESIEKSIDILNNKANRSRKISTLKIEGK